MKFVRSKEQAKEILRKQQENQIRQALSEKKGSTSSIRTNS